MEAGGERERAERAVGRDANVVRLGHGRNLFRLRDAAGVRNVGLDDVDAAELKVRPDVFPREEALAELLL